MPPPAVFPKMDSSPALQLTIIAKCNTTKARVCQMKLPHFTTDLPCFMPVGTKATMKGLTAHQLESLNIQILLCNTYHLGLKPGLDILNKIGGVHNWMGWNRNMLTDSGGFQMVSLMDLSKVTENGVEFTSPYDQNTRTNLSPEKSIEIQNAIGADIMMQLDDVVSPLTPRIRIEEAMWRSIRWLDRCIVSNKNPDRQNLFPIIQGGLHRDLREKCVEEMLKRNAPGYAIGGLSGGEEKTEFWKIVSLCTDLLPESKPRYCMGIGYALDLVICVALGVDMFDCVFPTRTARFGNALVPWGSIDLRKSIYKEDYLSIDPNCQCYTCKHYTRSYLRAVFKSKQPTACHLITLHNLAYMMQLMQSMRSAIEAQNFPKWIIGFCNEMFPSGNVPKWSVDALQSVGVMVD